jgi:hypothetical protein
MTSSQEVQSAILTTFVKPPDEITLIMSWLVGN